MMQIHPDLAVVLAAFQDAPPMDLSTTSVQTIRGFMEHMQLPAPQVVLHEVKDLEIPRLHAASGQGAIKARLYRPTAHPQAPVMVYLHGGGWCIGTIESHDGLCRHLAHITGMNVCSIDYRLAPEHVFPAGLDDAYEAVRWIAAHADELHSDAQQLTVAGDSAGGNLATACCLRAKQEGFDGIRQQLLFYPVCDVSGQTESYQLFGQVPMLTAANMARMWQLYHPSQPVHPLASVADAVDVSGLPPAVIVTAELDILRDEGQAYGQRLEQAGITVTQIVAKGMIHGFANFSAVAPAVEAVLREACAALEPVAAH